MRVAMDEQIFALQPYGGISRMFASLARQFFTEPDLGVDLLPLAAPVINRYVLDDDVIRTRLAVREASHEYAALLRYFIRVQPRRGLDIVHNTFYLPHGLAIYPRAKRVVTIHDMIPELMPQTRRRLDFLTVKRRYVRTADHIICVSEATKRDLVQVYGPIDAPISVVHHGVDPIFRPDHEAHSELPARYVLHVGNRGQYKDGRVLMKAFAEVAKHDRDLVLLFVGGGAFTADEQGLLSDLGVSARTIQVSLADRLMPAAYSNALMSVFPSRFEGFGLPALEAMACGTPTILARATSLPEVGGEAAVYFEPGNADELAAAMTRVLVDAQLSRDLTARGLERASHFTWHQTALRTVDAYRAALTG